MRESGASGAEPGLGQRRPGRRGSSAPPRPRTFQTRAGTTSGDGPPVSLQSRNERVSPAEETGPAATCRRDLEQVDSAELGRQRFAEKRALASDSKVDAEGAYTLPHGRESSTPRELASLGKPSPPKKNPLMPHARLSVSR
ncbi:hypothetical protein STEG23_008158 [Scotinomys teguina]